MTTERLLEIATEIAGRYRQGSLNPNTERYKHLMTDLAIAVDVARRGSHLDRIQHHLEKDDA